MKVKKRSRYLLLSAALIVALLCGILAVTASAETFSPPDDPLTYTILDESAKTAAVYGCEGDPTSVTIPETVEKDGVTYTVTQVAKGALKGLDSLERLTIAKTVKVIGAGAFENCIHLSELNFASDAQLTEIGKGAFAYTGKTDVEIAGLSTLTLPASLETLGEGAFRCIPVAAFALEDHSKLTEIPNGFLAADGDEGQAGTNTECKGIYDFITRLFTSYPEPFDSTPAQVAKACDCLVSIDFGDGNSLTRIGVAAFKNQTHLTSIDFGEDSLSAGLKIDGNAFVAAGNNALVEGEQLGSGIETLVFPANLTYLEDTAFKYAQIKNLVFSDGCLLEEFQGAFMEIDGQNGKPSTAPLLVASNSLETIDFGENNSFVTIGSGAFKNQSHLTSIDFGTSTADLNLNYGVFIGAGNNAYYVEHGIDTILNAGIETLTFPANLAGMGEGSFELARVKNVVFSDNCQLKVIGNNFLGVEGQDGTPHTGAIYVAANCLKTVDLGKNNSLESIGAGAFKNQSHLTSIDFGTSTAALNLNYGVFIGAGNNAYYVEELGESLNAGIETLTFPANLTGMGEGSFDVARVKNVVFSDDCQLQTIGNNFLGVGGGGGYPETSPVYVATNCLESVNFGKNNSLQSIRSGAFRNQSHLTEIDFGTSTAALTIGYGAFSGVGNNAHYVENGIDAKLNGIDTLTFPANLTVLDVGSFDFARVKNVVFSDDCQLKAIDNNFLGVDGGGGYPNTNPVYVAVNCLESVDLGKNNSLKSIGYGAFRNQSHLTKIDFGTSTAALEINYGAFSGVGNNAHYVENGIDAKLNGIDTLTFPANLTFLGEGSFDFARVKNVVFSDGCQLKAISNNFLGIDGSDATPNTNPVYVAVNCLESVDLGKNNSLKSIGYGAFRNQSHLTKIDFGTSTAALEINSGAFVGVGNNAHYVENGIDSRLNGIDTLTLPANLTTMDSGCFHLARVKNLVFSDNCKLKTIIYGFMTINGSDGKPSTDPVIVAANYLETIKFGANNALTTIESGAFKNYSSLKSIDFGKDETSDQLTISYGAFAGIKLDTLTLPANIAIGEGAFKKATIKHLVFADGCTMTKIGAGFLTRDYNDPNDAPVLASIDFGADSALETISEGAFAGNKNLKTLDLSGTKIKTIEKGAFNDCGLTTIILPSTLETLNNGAFQGLTSMQTLKLDSSFPLTKLEGGVFSKCAVLTTVDLLDSNIVTIGDALKENPNLTRIVFPATLRNITWADTTDDEVCPFYGCGKVRTLKFAELDPSVYSFTAGVFQFLNESGTVYVPADTTDDNIEAYKALLTNCGLSFEEGKWKITNKPEESEPFTVYAINVADTEHGAISVEPNGDCSSNTLVTITVTPDKGFTLEILSVTDENGDEVALTNKGDGVYTFRMPESDVTILATFMDDNTMLNFFVDVHADDYFYDPVLWAVENGITNGTDELHFSPNDPCTRGQTVTFLWRAAGSPAPTTEVCPFTDVAEGAYYYDAVLWAYEKGITTGTTDTTFTPDGKVTRGQTVTFLWRYEKEPAAAVSETPFTDVDADAYYYGAVLWAVEKEITNGTTETTFSPDDFCTRGQIVTFLYRDMAK